jgi:heterodisulfide reductase subunit B
MVALCPMCQMNLDAFQGQVNGYFKTDYKMPILFFTQLMGIAFGQKPEELGFGSEFVSARAAMSRIGVQTPEPVTEGAPAAPKPRKPEGLPMPPPRTRTRKTAGFTEEVGK